MNRSVARAAAAVALAVALPALAASPVGEPVTFTLSGRLLDATDTPVEGDLDLTVRIYRKSSDASGEHNLVWEQAYPKVHVLKGVLAILVGNPDAGQVIAADVFSTSEQRWITIAIGANEMMPRQRLGTVPFAAHAADAATVGGKVPADFAAAAHTHPSADVTDFAAQATAAALASGRFAGAAHTHPSTDVTDFAARAAAAALASGQFAGATHTHAAADVTDFDSAAVAAAQASGKFSHTAGTGITLSATGDIALDAAQAGLLAGAQTFTGVKTFAPTSGTAPFAVGAGRTGVVTGLNADLASGVKLNTLKTFACPTGQLLTGFAVTAGTSELTGVCSPPPPLPTSCLAVKANNASAADGTYTIFPNGVATATYCDMTTDGGGWTMVYNNNFNGNDGGPTGAQMFGVYGTAGLGSNFSLNAATVFAGVGASKMMLKETIGATTTWIRFNNMTASLLGSFWSPPPDQSWNVTSMNGTTYTVTNGNHIHSAGVNQFGLGGTANASVMFEYNMLTGARDTNHYWHLWAGSTGTYAIGESVGGSRWGAVLVR